MPRTPDEVGFSAIERTMLRNILGLHERRIADVMVHRADIVAVKRDIPLGELMSLFESAAHSRLVVYNETLDDPEGIVHIRDLLAFMTAKARVADAEATPGARNLCPPASICARSISRCRWRDANIIRKLLYVPPSMRAIDLLAQMQASRIHLALVVDEYGGTDGLVSIEDIVEQIVGEIDDEHDSDEPPAIVRQADNSFIADARASLDDVRSVIGEDFVTGEAGEEVETLGGYLVTHVGRLPVRGEVISGPGNFEIEVLDADPRRVKRLRIATAQGTRRAAAPKPPPRSAAGGRPRPGHRQPAPFAAERRSRLSVISTITSAALAHSRSSCPGAGSAPSSRLCGRAVGAGDGAVQCLAGAVPDLSGHGLADRRRRRRRLRGVPAAAIAGWWFGLGYFVPGLYWIGYAFLVDASTFAWLLPFAIFGLPAYLALFTAFGFALARLIWTTRRLARARARRQPDDREWLRGHVLTGFPWNAFGYALTEPLALAQTRVADRPVGPDVPRGRDLRKSRGADRWRFARPQAVDRAAAGAAAARCHGRLRRRPPDAAADPARSQASSCGSCSPTCSRTRNSTIPPRRR